MVTDCNLVQVLLKRFHLNQKVKTWNCEMRLQN